MRPARLAFVVQRYGAEVNGGAEFHCRLLAERLAARSEVTDATVFTSCALDYDTWKNHYDPGVSELGGLRVERFRTWFPRIEVPQYLLSKVAFKGHGPRAVDELWVNAQGPTMPGLLRRLREIRHDYDAFIFFTYLYYPTIYGLEQVRSRILVPTAHDEPPIYMRRFRKVFSAPEALAFNTEEEQEFVEQKFDTSQAIRDIVACGIDVPPESELAEPERARDKPYILFLGRISDAKGCGKLARAFGEFRRRHAQTPFERGDGTSYRGADLELVYAGRGEVDGLDAPNIVREGFVSDERKLELLRGCEALVLPSIFESLSLVMLEAWAERRPVIVDGGCAVTAGHIHRSGGGETYADSAEFSASLARMLADAKRRGAQAASGRRYVEERYRWTEVEDRMLSLVERVRASATG